MSILSILGLVLGVVVLAYGVLAYTGSSVLEGAPPALRRTGETLWLAGIVLLALALMLGIVGSLISTDLRILRILIGIVGLVILGLAWPRKTKAV